MPAPPDEPYSSDVISQRGARGVRAWLRELFAIDLRSLAVLRMALGLCVVVDVCVRARDLVGLYTDRGALPRGLLSALDGPAVQFSAHYWAGADPWLQGALFAFTALCGIALALGWRTRLITLACWYLVVSVQVRQPLVYMGGDSILRLLLFWCLFLPIQARFSLDARQSRVRPMRDRFVSGATVALLIQVCLIYWVTGYRKTGELWWNGDAVFFALHSETLVTAFGVWLRDYRTLLEWMTYATLVIELLGPFLAFVPVFTGAFRVATILLFWGFHAGLAMTMNIGLFPLFSMVAWLAFLPTDVWRWLGGTSRVPLEQPLTWRARALSVAAMFCLLYVVILVAERVRVIPQVLPGPLIRVGTALRIQQAWAMFAPEPRRATQLAVLRWTMSDGSVHTEPAASGFRWTMYVGRVTRAERPDLDLLEQFAQYRCLVRNTAVAGDVRAERVAVVSERRSISRDGFGPLESRVLLEDICYH